MNQRGRTWMPKHHVNSVEDKSCLYCNNFPRRHLVLVLIAVILGCITILGLILPNVFLYLMLPTLCKHLQSFSVDVIYHFWLMNISFVLVQRPVNQSNFTKSVQYANHCGGEAPYTRWNVYVDLAINMFIDARNCTFNSTPLYFCTIIGYGLHNNIMSNNALYSPSRLGFSIYVRPYIYWNASLMLNYSQIYRWNVTWIGIEYWKYCFAYAYRCHSDFSNNTNKNERTKLLRNHLASSICNYILYFGIPTIVYY